MKVFKIMVLIAGLSAVLLSGCGGGGGGGGTTPAALITASMNSVITGSNAVGTVTVSGLPAATACGLSVQITYPATVTFVSAISSGVTPIGSSVTPGTIGLTGTEVFITGSTGFGSGEVMKISFSNVLPADLLGATITSVFNCSGVQIQ
ncbi:MAG: hypothetical protein HGB32_11625 [Geobacteraceae bacterium]|nr:hypothetical protein [Geobacteraceae bacterium]NTW80777.1 hypothetical protein [Geobacteraceae bacterium]